MKFGYSFSAHDFTTVPRMLVRSCGLGDIGLVEVVRLLTRCGDDSGGDLAGLLEGCQLTSGGAKFCGVTMSGALGTHCFPDFSHLQEGHETGDVDFAGGFYGRIWLRCLLGVLK